MSSICDEDTKKTGLVYKKKKKHYCSNCGKYGHTFKKCKDQLVASVDAPRPFLVSVCDKRFWLSTHFKRHLLFC